MFFAHVGMGAHRIEKCILLVNSHCLKLVMLGKLLLLFTPDPMYSEVASPFLRVPSAAMYACDLFIRQLIPGRRAIASHLAFLRELPM